MRKCRFVLFLIICFSSPFLFSQSKVLVTKEIDLSFFLKPNQYYTIVAADDFGNLLISQRDVLEEFLRVDKGGNPTGQGPEKREGAIMNLDVTASGDPVVLFKRTPDQVFSGKAAWACIVYNRLSLTKKKEFDFAVVKERFRTVSDLRVLRPRDEILIRGIRPDRDDHHSLYVMDMTGKVLRSFSPYQGELDPLQDQMKFSDVFALGPCMLAIDSVNHRIFQKFPFSKIVKIFSFDGLPLSEIPWETSELSQFAVFNGDILWESFPVAQDGDGKMAQRQGPYIILRKQGNAYLSRGEHVECNPGLNGILLSYDQAGNLYFLCGEERRVLKICRLD
jgi:hypothetical protein